MTRANDPLRSHDPVRHLIACSVLTVLGTALVAPTGPAADAAAPTTCTGTVFVDLDADGEQREALSRDLVVDDVEPGIAGVELVITDRLGDRHTTRTDGAGRWRTDLTADRYPLRLEFEIPDGFHETALGVASSTSIQFVDRPESCGGAIGSVGFVDPDRYCAADAPVVVACHLRDDVGLLDEERRPLDDTNVKIVADDIRDTRAGEPWGDDAWLTRPTTPVADIERIGTVYGIAVARDGRIFASSFVKRHTTLVSELNPTGNPTAIFRLGAGERPELFTVVDPTAGDPHRPDGRDTDDDTAVMDDVFRSGLGDIELSLDQQRLWAVDLGRRALVEIDADTGEVLGTTPLDAIRLGIEHCGATAQRPFGDTRPFGLGIGPDGELLVGVVCSAESTVTDEQLPVDDTIADPTPAGDHEQLAGYVFEFDGERFLRRLAWPLAADRGETFDVQMLAHDAAWHPWVDVYPFLADHDVASYPQPAITDVSVDADGNLLVALGDRWAHQTAPLDRIPAVDGFREVDEVVAAGDLQRACPSRDGWEIEGTPGCDGGVGDGWEFFDGDRYGWHAENVLGSIAGRPGHREVVATHFDPIPDDDTWQSGGLGWHDTTDGRWLDGLRIYDGKHARPDGTFENAGGMGDIEFLCGEVPIVVGGRVWYDPDADGDPGPDEPGVFGVRVELRDRVGALVATTVTDEQGRYQFDERTIDEEIDAGRAYTVEVAADAHRTGPFGPAGRWTGLRPVAPDDLLDGRVALAFVAGDDPSTDATEPRIRHGLDVAMTDQYDLALFAALGRRGDELDVLGLDLLVVNQGSLPSGAFTVEGRVPPGGELVSAGDGSIPAEVDGDVVTWRVDAAHQLAPGQVIRLPIEVRVARRGDTEYVYAAQITAADGDDDDSTPGNAFLDHPATLRPATGGDDLADEFAVGPWEDDATAFTVTLRTLAGTIWFDRDLDGVRDQEIDHREAAAPGVEVRLLREDGTEFARSVTDHEGWYEFPLVDAATYRLELTRENFESGGPLDGFDVVVEPDGSLSSASGYVSPPVVIAVDDPVLVTDLGVARRRANGVFGGNGTLLLGPAVLLGTYLVLRSQRRRHRFGTGDLG